jgi:hypothetical protein
VYSWSYSWTVLNFPQRTDIRELCAWLAAQLADG